jgi:hypothetical protein
MNAAAEVTAGAATADGVGDAEGTPEPSYTDRCQSPPHVCEASPVQGESQADESAGFESVLPQKHYQPGQPHVGIRMRMGRTSLPYSVPE